MRILLLNQFFYRDSAATSQFPADLARRLAVEGHSVRVTCGSSLYAETDSLNPPRRGDQTHCGAPLRPPGTRGRKAIVEAEK